MPLGLGIELSSQFDVLTNKSLDARDTFANATERDALPATSRYAYMMVTTVDDGLVWRLVGGIANANWEEFSSGGSGGGSGSLSGYRVDGQSAPLDGSINTIPVLTFSSGVSDEHYYYKIVVPTSYTAGNRIKLSNGQVAVNSTDTTKDILINANTFLIKPGDTIASFANLAYGSTNVEVAPTATAYAAINLGDIFLNDGSGNVDSRAPAAGDNLIVRLRRQVSGETATYDGEVFLLKDSFNVSFE